jgi:hypothetical protein
LEAKPEPVVKLLDLDEAPVDQVSEKITNFLIQQQQMMQEEQPMPEKPAEQEPLN